MKIMYVTDQLYLHGGIEKMLAQKINYWIVNYGYEVVLCTSEQRNNDFIYEVDSKLKHVNLAINYFRNQSYFHPKNILKSILHFKFLRELIRKENPDIIISVNYTPEQFLLPFIAKRIPKVKEFHSSGAIMNMPNTIIDKLKYQLFLILGYYRAQVVLNQDEKKYYPFRDIHVIPNFMDNNGKEEILQKEKTILAAGRIASVKQFDHLIKAWSIIAVDFPGWQVKIFGDGDEVLSAKLKQLILHLKVPNIYLMGATSHLQQEMQKASIYAMTSATECFPMVLLEAQAAGLPVISYDCPNGPRNIIINKQDGLLTPHNDISVFAKKLGIFIQNECDRKTMAIVAKQNVVQFSSKIVMKQWNDLLLKLLAEKYV